MAPLASDLSANGSRASRLVVLGVMAGLASATARTLPPCVRCSASLATPHRLPGSLRVKQTAAMSGSDEKEPCKSEWKSALKLAHAPESESSSWMRQTKTLAELPGDPSLILNTNVVISDKMEFMKATSKIIAEKLSKPETYVAVCVNDGLDVIWAGEATPCALGTLCSIGQINQVSQQLM